MGLLDDAIREHLELKRRRGADPTEVERAEREALGPARRGPEELGLDPVAAAEAPEDAISYTPAEPAHEDLEPEPSLGAPSRDDYVPEPDEPMGLDALSDYEPEPADPPASIPRPHPAGGFDPGPPESPPSMPEHVGPETVEYNVAAEHGDKEGDDVLEETPEFLQDTPDHDRLWFEQRPPRDFDFDS